MVKFKREISKQAKTKNSPKSFINIIFFFSHLSFEIEINQIFLDSIEASSKITLEKSHDPLKKRKCTRHDKSQQRSSFRGAR